MNLEELHSALTSMAEEVSDDSTMRLSSVSRRVRATRRHQVMGVFATVCAIAVAFALFPQWSSLLKPDTTGPAEQPHFGSLQTVTDGDLVVYQNAGGVRLLGDQVGRKGAHAVSVSVTPTTGNLGWSEFCLTPGSAAGAGPNSTTSAGLTFHLSVNGTPVPSAVLERLRYTGAAQLSHPNSTCDDGAQPMQMQRSLALDPEKNIKVWQRLGVKPDATSLVTLRATADSSDAGRAALAATTMELAVFEKPMHPVRKHRVWIDRHIVDPGDATGAFELADWQFTSVQQGSHNLTVPMPTTDRQVYVRTFVARGEGHGVLLRHGANTPGEIGSTLSPLHIERLVAPRASTIHAATVIVPAGDQRLVAVLVYVRYE